MKLVKLIGWMLFPYVMIFVQWKRLKLLARVLGILWAAFLVVRLAQVEILNIQSQSQVVAASVSSNSTPAAQNTEVIKHVSRSNASNSSVLHHSTNTAPKTNKKPTNSTQTQVQAVWNELLSFPRMGQSHEVGSFNITVNGISQYKYVGSDTANGMYWVVSLTVRNDGSYPTTIDDNMFQIVSPPIRGTANSYSADTSADIEANLNDNFFLTTLNPGVSSTGYVVFDMPSKYTSEYMQLFHLFVDSGLLSAKQSFSFLQ